MRAPAKISTRIHRWSRGEPMNCAASPMASASAREQLVFMLRRGGASAMSTTSPRGPFILNLRRRHACLPNLRIHRRTFPMSNTRAGQLSMLILRHGALVNDESTTFQLWRTTSVRHIGGRRLRQGTRLAISFTDRTRCNLVRRSRWIQRIGLRWVRLSAKSRQRFHRKREEGEKGGSSNLAKDEIRE